MDYAVLKTNAAALAGTDAQVLAQLQAQTVTGPLQPTSILGMQSILLASASADWARVVLRSRMTPSGAATDAAIMAAITATGLVGSAGAGGLLNVDTGTPAVATQLDAMLGGLHQVGDLSTDTVTKVQAMRAPLVTLAWPGLVMDDLAAARMLP